MDIVTFNGKKAVFSLIAIIAVVSIIGLVAFSGGTQMASAAKGGDSGVVRVGWISDLSGPFSKFGAKEAGLLAVERINSAGGINGKRLELVMEDGKGNGRDAVTAMQKLINVDGMRIVLGGHNTPESTSIAPIAEANRVLMLASITTTPALTNAGDYVFRTSPVSTILSEMTADAAFNKLGYRRFAVISEQTEYALPIAEKFRQKIESYGGTVVAFESFAPGTTDFRTILALVRDKNPEALFLSAHGTESGYSLMKQIREAGLRQQLFANEATTIQVNIDRIPGAYEGLITASPDFNREAPKTREFIEAYKKKYGVSDLPYGVWTAETYDGVMIMADAIAKNGTDIEKIKQYLYGLRDYDGVSGKISIDSSGDGVRKYGLKIVRDGKPVDYKG